MNPPDLPQPPSQPALSIDTGPIPLLEALLKRPAALIAHFQNDARGAGAGIWLLGFAVLFASIYGVIVGSFSGGHQIWIAPVKTAIGMLLSVLICLPSLYIFACLSGVEARARTIAGVLFAAACVMSLLLIGFAPVAWIFSQSTDNVAFMAGLHLLFWAIGAYFGLRVITTMAKSLRVSERGHLRVWMMIFVLVCLQMMTALRPIIGTSDRFLPESKKFFLAHWFDTMSGSEHASR